MEKELEKINDQMMWFWRRGYDLRMQIQKGLIKDPLIYYYMTWLINRYHDQIMLLGKKLDQLVGGI